MESCSSVSAQVHSQTLHSGFSLSLPVKYGSFETVTPETPVYCMKVKTVAVLHCSRGGFL